MSVADPRVLAREAVLSTVVAASLASILVWLGPPGVDLAAHAYQRTLLIHHGFVVWNNFWYAGRYTFVTYSVLYYPLAALLGIKVLAVATIASAALAFTLVALRQWGDSALLSSRTFAVLWTGIVLSAAFPFALAMSFALLSLWALQSRHRWRFAVFALLCLATSPLAFVLLGVLLGGVALARKTLRDIRLPLAIMVGGGLVELGIYRLFADGGRFPFSIWEFAGSLVFCAFGLAVTWDIPAARPLRGLFAVYLVACLAAFLIPTSVGSNIDRIRYAALPIAVLALTLRRWRPLPLVVPALVLAAVWNLTPIVSSYASASTDPGRKQAYWQPAIRYLHAHLSPSFRVEAVDTADHWAAEYLPDAGIPIVRGWYRQADFPVNSVLYNDDLTPAQYDAWLRSLGVRFVLLPDAPPDYSSRHEAALIRSGRVNLKLVYRSAHIRVYEVPNASPMITGPAGGTVLYLEPTRIVAELPEAGTYHVKVRWTPFWRTKQGCVSRASDGMVNLVVPHPGVASLSVSVDVDGGLKALTGRSPRRVCGS